MAKAEPKIKEQKLTIKAPNIQVATFVVRGDAPYVGNKFSARAKQEMIKKQEAGSTSNSRGKARAPKDFKKLYEESIRRSKQGWEGIAAPAFRNAMISACRTCGFKMAHAKLAVFIMADGADVDDDMPLVKITRGKPKYAEHYVRLADGKTCDIRARPMWEAGWEAVVRVRFDADMFTVSGVANLLSRAGLQVGIGAGRHDSKQSNGLGWGTFEVASK